MQLGCILLDIFLDYKIFKSFPNDSGHSFLEASNKKGNKIFLNFIKPLIALSLLFIPAAVAVIYANKFADWLYGPLNEILKSALNVIDSWPSLFASLMGGNYGLVAMFPFLILYAIPTIVISQS